MIRGTLAGLVLLLAAGRVAADDAEKTKAIVEKAVRAHGGAGKLLRDWKETDGAKYPAKASVRRKDGTLHLRTEFLELERLKAPPAGK